MLSLYVKYKVMRKTKQINGSEVDKVPLFFEQLLVMLMITPYCTSAFLASETTAADSGLYRARDPARTCIQGKEKKTHLLELVIL